MDFLDSDVSSDIETDETSTDELDIVDDVQPHEDGYDSPTEDNTPTVDEVTVENPSTSVGTADNEPTLGMCFDSWESAQVFYNDYAQRTGFSVRIRDGQRSKAGRGIRLEDRPFLSREFVCSKEGFNRGKKNRNEGNNIQYMKTRTGCLAKLSVKKDKNSANWHITKLEKAHNHEMVTPSKTCYLRSHRRLSKFDKGLLQDASDARMRPLEITNFLSNATGGPSNIYKKMMFSVNDIDAVREYCVRMSEEDPEFFYTIQINTEGQMTNFFWVDGRAKTSYKYFGDVVIFDTAYKKNRYKMTFAPFMGVNHHQRNILFGCALLADETEATFTWLFQTWLVAMSNCPPVSIITDQDAGIEGAIKKVFPGSCHRFNLWHIMKKFSKYFSSIYHSQPQFKIDLHKCLHKTYSEDEFELCWKELVEFYKIKDHHYVQLMYSIRKQWVPTFLRDSFFVGMNSSQRNESTNWMFGQVLKTGTTLQEFMKVYEEMEDKRYEEENHDDFIDIDKFPIMKTQFSIEKDAAKIYTKEIFRIFQAQLFNSCGYSCQKKQTDGDNIVYGVTKDEKGFRSYTVRFNPLEKTVECSCRMFESVGILCRHSLNIFFHHQLKAIPSHYVLRRWTKDARKGELGRRATDISIESNKDVVFRYTNLMQDCKVIAQRVSKKEENYQLFKNHLKVFSESIMNLDATQVKLESSNHRCTRRNILGDLMEDSIAPNDRSNLANLAIVSAEGGSSGKRQLSGLEMSTRKRRKCKMCNNIGHNRRSCPNTKGDNTLASSSGRGSPGQGLSSDDYVDEAQFSQDIPQTAPSIDSTQPGFEGSA